MRIYLLDLRTTGRFYKKDENDLLSFKSRLEDLRKERVRILKLGKDRSRT